MNLAPSPFPTPAAGEVLSPRIPLLAPVPGEQLPPCVRSAVAILSEALDCAQELQRDEWDFAVEIHYLRGGGLSDSGLRWLLCKGYAEHAVETTQAHAPHRTFRRTGSLVFSDRSCFVLTEAGAALAGQPGSLPRALGRPGPSPTSSSRPALWPAVPHWDDQRHELRWGAKLVKRFRVPALNQELILAAFEEEGWPPHLDDPLPNNDHTDPKQRLHDTIKRLNRRQINRLLYFRGDGSGTGVLWEAVD